ncbi:MAG: hypothetical protein RR639_04215 [Hydrogenoanaerobacterium sp.]
MNNTKITIGQELPKEAWLGVAERLNIIAPIFANQLKKLNYEGQGKQDAEELMNDMMLAKIALNYVAQNATDKCRFIGI